MKSKLTIQDFDKFREIGHGAFGKVYQAIFKKNGKQYALKKISKREIKNNNMMTQISNQIQISKKLQHPNIIKLYEYFDDSSDIFLVLELAKGGQLYSRLMKLGRFDQEETKKMIKQTISAVKYLHQNKIIHRDIKPENILLDKKGNVKLADFGWSNFTGQKPRKTYCGTVDYLAPQMIDKSGHDQKLDIWCLGVLVYELLTGKTPFVSQNAKGPQKKKIIEQNILKMNINFPNDFPIAAKSFVLGMIRRNPKQRMSLEQIQGHQWLQSRVSQKGQQLHIMQKKPPLEYINIDTGSSSTNYNTSNNNITTNEPTISQQNPQLNQKLQQLKRRNRQLQQQIQLLRANNKLRQDNKFQSANNVQQQQLQNLMKQLRRLRPLEQKLPKLQKDYDDLWEDINKKDKEIIILKAELKRVDDLNQECQTLRSQKKRFEDKFRKLERQHNQLKQREKEMKEQLSQLSSNVKTKIKTGQKLAGADASSPQFVQYLQQQLQLLQQKFQQSRKILLKVLQKQKISKQKQDQLGRLKAQQKKLKQILKSQLRNEFQNEKDQILLNARKQLNQQKEKWMKQREILKKIYQEGQVINQSDGLNGLNKEQNLELELRTIKELNGYYEKTISQQNFRIKDLENQLTRKK